MSAVERVDLDSRGVFVGERSIEFIQEHFKSIEEKLDKLVHLVYEGNGTPSLLSRVHLIEKSTQENIEDITENRKTLHDLRNRMITTELGLQKLEKKDEKNDEKDEKKDDRVDTKTWNIVAIVISSFISFALGLGGQFLLQVMKH